MSDQSRIPDDGAPDSYASSPEAAPVATRRRGFFALVGAGGVAGAAAVVASKTATVEALAAEATDAGEGYRLTEHIRKYYRTTTV